MLSLTLQRKYKRETASGKFLWLRLGTGHLIDEPKEIFSHKGNPVVLSKNKLYTSTRSKLISDAIEWRDSKQFNFPTEVTTTPISSWDTFGDRPFDADETAIGRENLSVHSSIIDTNDTQIECTAYCGADQGALGVMVRDINTDEVLAHKKDALSGIYGVSGEKTTWVNPRIIPWRSNGADPDKFIIIVSAKLSPGDTSPTVGTQAYRVVVITLDSMTGPSIDDGQGDLWSWLGISDPVFQDFQWLVFPNDDERVRKYSHSTDLIYDKEQSVAWFVLGGSGMREFYIDEYTNPAPMYIDTLWEQRVYVIKISQGGTSSGFTGEVHSRTAPIDSDTHDQVPNVDPNPAFDDNIWELSFGNPNKTPTPAIPGFVEDIPQEPRWGKSGRSTYEDADGNLIKRVQGYNFDEIFKVSASEATNATLNDSINIVCSSVCRDQLNTTPPLPIHTTRQRTFLVSVNKNVPDTAMPRTDLTGGLDQDITDTTAVPSTPTDFICTNAQFIEPYIGTPGALPNMNGYVVLYFEEQINNSFIRLNILTGLRRGGGRRFFTLVVSVSGWDRVLQTTVSKKYSDLLSFTKPAARGALVEYGPSNPDHPESDRSYLVLPVVRKNVPLMGRDTYSGDLYVLTYDSLPNKEFPTSTTASLSEPHTIAKAMDGISLGSVSEPIAISGSYHNENVFSFDFPTYSSPLEIGLRNISINLNPNINALEYGSNLYTTGGFLKCWNGSSYYENNFHFRPMIIDMDNDGFTSPVTPRDFLKTEWIETLGRAIGNSPFTEGEGSDISRDAKEEQYGSSYFLDPHNETNPAYQFRFVYEWVDGNGEIHQSAPSEVVVVQSKTIYVDPGPPVQPPPDPPYYEIGVLPTYDPGDEPPWELERGKIRFRLSMLPPAFTDKNDIESITIKAYRSLDLVGEEASGADGALYEDVSAAMQGSYHFKNMNSGMTTSDLTVEVVFDEKDNAIADSKMIYTSLGDLKYIGSPPCSRLTEHDGRLFALASEDPYKINYSNSRRVLSATNFNESANIKVKQEGGPLVGLASLSGKLILFKENSIFVVFGTPINSSGTSGGYSNPQEFSDTVGCSNPMSISETTEGVFFQSDKDLYLIDKGYNLVKLGVEVPLNEGQQITSVIRKPDVNEIRFCHDSGMLVYNTWFKQWTRFSLGSTGNSVTIGNRQYIIEKVSKRILKEDPDYYGDGEDAVSTDIETAWIKLASSQGVQRVKNILFLGELDSQSSFDLEIYYNYNNLVAETVSVDASDIASLDNWGSESEWGTDAVWGGDDTDHVFQFRHKPKIQKCESIKFRIKEKMSTNPTKGYALNTLLLEVGPKKGAMKLPSSKTV